MADPAVTLTNGVPTSGNGLITTLGQVLDPTTGPAAIKGAGTGSAATSDKALVVTLRDVNANGGNTPANSAPVVAADQYAQYKTCPVSTTTTIGVTGAGAAGDYLAGVLVFPAANNCGSVTVYDSAIATATTIGVFAGGGTTVLADLKPFLIPVGLFSTAGAWKVACGTNVTATAIGKF
jgi:hypothetical protein